MNKLLRIGMTTGKTLRLVILVILLVLAGGAFNANAQTVTNLYHFGAFPLDGFSSRATLVQGSDGNFYGTTHGGGRQSHGTVFRTSPSGTYTNLYSFSTSHGDGFEPEAGLVQGSDGNFYGTTSSGPGVVFRISPSGSETNLHSFGSVPNDGTFSYGRLLQGIDGNLYGTTVYGGTNNNGTVFRISPSGTYTSLYPFVGYPNDGANPYAGLVQGSDSNFYGTTEVGGTSTNCGGSGCGTVFRISPGGSYTTLYSFVGYPTDGNNPEAGLVQGSDGNFYGTTAYGGNTDGTVFRISPSGSYKNLYSFSLVFADGSNPQAALVQGSDGDFYGTTANGGIYNKGTVFRINPSGTYTSLYSFVGYPNAGAYPTAGLVQGSDGNFYGTTTGGGTNNEGTVFRLSVLLNPPANQISAVQIAGSDVAFSIPSVAAETYQLQFSSSMTPTNWVNVPVSVTNSIGSLLTLTNFGGAVGPQGFYRFDITP